MFPEDSDAIQDLTGQTVDTLKDYYRGEKEKKSDIIPCYVSFIYRLISPQRTTLVSFLLKVSGPAYDSELHRPADFTNWVPYHSTDFRFERQILTPNYHLPGLNYQPCFTDFN